MNDSLRKKEKLSLGTFYGFHSLRNRVFFFLNKPMLFHSEKEPWVIFQLKPEDAICQKELAGWINQLANRTRPNQKFV